MDFLIKAAQLLLSLSLLVILHEFGHFIPARLFKTRVEKFYLFFNPWFSLFKKKIGETEWGIGWLPLGGFVKIAGMVDESMDKEQLALPPQPWEFRSKPAWQRLIIMLGGVFVNVVVGFLIYIFVVFAYGKTEFKPSELKSGLSVHPYFEQFGLKSGDNVLEMEGEKFNHYVDFKMKVLDINNEILLRGVRKLKIQHADGSVEDITLPDNIDYKIFEEAAFPVFKNRGKNMGVEFLFAIVKNKKLGLDLGDKLIAVNNQKIGKYSTEEPIKTITVERGTEKININTNKVPMDSLFACFPTLSIGLHENDKIIAANSKKIIFTDDLQSVLYFNKGKKVNLSILHNGDTLQRELKVSSTAMMGFTYKDLAKSETQMFNTKYFSFGESVSLGLQDGKNTIGDYASQLKFLFTKKGASSLGGFASMGKLFPSTWDWHAFWNITGFISLVLAFMNLLPIPALDGGHVVFLLYEMVTGKEAPQKVLEYAQYAGIFFLLGLMLYANGMDVFRWITG